MPFSIDFYQGKAQSSENHLSGRIFIDRNNFIIQFIPNRFISFRKAHSLRDDLETNVIEKMRKDLKHLVVFFYNNDKHPIIDHMCKSDKKPAHYHVKFIRDFDYEIFKVMFNPKYQHLWLQFLSQECYDNILKIIPAYLAELKLSPMAKKIEAEYQQDKKQQLANFERQLKSNKKDTGAPSRFFFHQSKGSNNNDERQKATQTTLQAMKQSDQMEKKFRAKTSL